MITETARPEPGEGPALSPVEGARAEAQERRRPPGRAGWRWASRAARLGGFLLSLALVVLLALIVAAAALPLFGYRTRVIYGGSMEPAIGRGSLVVARLVDPETLAVGDIINFRRPEAKAMITHRIVAIREENGERWFTVKGDANPSPDPNEVSFTTDVGKVVMDIPYAGFLVGFARSPQGMVLLLVLPALGLAFLQISGRGKRESAPK